MDTGLSKRIKTFTDLNVWKEGHSLVLSIYRITQKFPKEETYSLIDQIRRSASSITNNIAEGFGRHTYKEKIQFYYLSSGSISELKNQLLVSRDVGYITTKTFNELALQANTTHKLLNGLIKKTKYYSKIQNQKSIIQ